MTPRIADTKQAWVEVDDLDEDDTLYSIIKEGVYEYGFLAGEENGWVLIEYQLDAYGKVIPHQ